MSVTCLREFPPLEYFFCLGCHDRQMKFVDVDNKKVHVCPSFAKKLWNHMDYDRCGLALGDSRTWPFIKPWAEYSSAQEFLNVDAIKPPYFDDYEIVIDSAESSNCFTSAGWRAAVSGIVSAIVAVAMVANLA